MTTHALLTPWPISVGLRTWCGLDRKAKPPAMIATTPEAVDCERCRSAMRRAYETLGKWVPRLPGGARVDGGETMLILSGDLGTGKTHNLIEIAKRHLTRGERVAFVNAYASWAHKELARKELRDIEFFSLDDLRPMAGRRFDVVLIDAMDRFREGRAFALSLSGATVVLATEEPPGVAWDTPGATVIHLRPRT